MADFLGVIPGGGAVAVYRDPKEGKFRIPIVAFVLEQHSFDGERLYQLVPLCLTSDGETSHAENDINFDHYVVPDRSGT